MRSDGPSWSDIAEWYNDLLQSGSGPHETALRCVDRLVPEVDGSEVIDVACGQGVASRHLASRGARVTGVDSSEAMIDIADQHGTPAGLDVSYVVDDAQTLSKFEDSTFDGAVCQLGLMDIGDLGLRNAAAHGRHEELSRERAGLLEQQVNLFFRRLEQLLHNSSLKDGSVEE